MEEQEPIGQFHRRRETAQNYPQAEPSREPSRSPMTMNRKAELVGLARCIAENVAGQTEPHERCFLRQMVEMWLEPMRT